VSRLVRDGGGITNSCRISFTAGNLHKISSLLYTIPGNILPKVVILDRGEAGI
jgi:hypothetical protein